MKKTFALVIIFLFGILYIGCSDNSTDPGNPQGKGGVQFKIDKANAPADVTYVEAVMIGGSGDTLVAVMDMKSDTTAEITFTDIEVGTWYLTVNAYNRDNVLLYTGSAEIEIKAGILVQVSLVLEPTGFGTGSVQIYVTWGTSLTKTLILQPGVEGKDNELYYLNSDFNRDPWQDLILFGGTNDGIWNKYRCLIEFNLSSIPKNAKVKSAVLDLYYNSTSGFKWGGQKHEGENAFTIERVIENWAENTVTWNTQPATDTSDYVYVPKSEIDTQDYTIDITSLVQASVNQPENSHGFKLKLVDESPYSQVMLYSSDSPFADKRPKLTVVYEN